MMLRVRQVESLPPKIVMKERADSRVAQNIQIQLDSCLIVEDKGSPAGVNVAGHRNTEHHHCINPSLHEVLTHVVNDFYKCRKLDPPRATKHRHLKVVQIEGLP